MGEERIRCPYCAELILTDAKICRFCQRWLREDEPESRQVSPVESVDPPDVSVEAPVEDTKIEAEKPVAQAQVQEVRKVAIRSFADAPKPQPKAKAVKGSFPWLRIMLFLSYIALITGLVMMERHALEGLSAAKAKETSRDYKGALEGYEGIRDGFPFSFSVFLAHEGIRRVVDQGGLTSHEPVKPPVLGEFVGEEFKGSAVYWLPFVSWPICAVLLGLVLLSRILRVGVVFLSLILGVVAVLGTAIQVSWYGLCNIEQLAEISKTVMNEPLLLYGATYGLMVITALMTLTRTRRRVSK